jgi:hypothetical protein
MLVILWYNMVERSPHQDALLCHGRFSVRPVLRDVVASIL